MEPVRARTVILGVDPGASGAVAVLIDGGLMEVADMPFLFIQEGGRERRKIDLHGLHDLMQRLVQAHVGPIDEVSVVVEEVSAMPKDGPVQAFAFGMAYCAVLMCAVSHRWPLRKVRPAIWKRGLKLKKGKDASRQRAMDEYPAFREQFARVKDDGRAEAALIAYWAYLEIKKGTL